MTTYVSYVIQDEKGHVHKSEIITSPNTPDSYSPVPQVSDVIKWADEKKRQLRPTQELVITGMYKI